MMRSGWFKAGNINLRGRKSAALRCGCCTAYDLRERAIAHDVRKEIDDAIDEWHDGDAPVELHEYLGWTQEEYASWVQTGEIPDYPA